MLVLALICSMFVAATGHAQETDVSCAARIEKWEQALQDVQDKYNAFVAILQTPAERITQRPIFAASGGKTIARQVSEALQAKDDLLGAKRKDCRSALSQEDELFNELRGCVDGQKSAKNKEVLKLVKKRKGLVDRIALGISEVREVEGKETVMPYTDAMRDMQDPYRRSVNNYWQNYQQMYRRWWGR